MMDSHVPCFVIPNYNHGAGFDQIIDKLLAYKLPVIVVNDGSSAEDTRLLDALDHKYQEVTVLHLDSNHGKGHAVMKGIRHAAKMGCTHVLQLDADGQHDISDVDRFLTASRNYPGSVIIGQPQFDESIPRSRFCFRYLNHFFVWIETLSFQIKDSMCGYRVYPVQTSILLFDKYRLGERMDFDIEVLVKMFWDGVTPVSVPTRVTYPANNTANFRLVKDNALITRMHVMLVFGMLVRIPALLTRRRPARDARHWSDIKEKGSYLGLELLLKTYRLFGRWLFMLLLYPIIAYYTVVARDARNASRQYLLQIDSFASGNLFHGKVSWKTIFAHFYAFGVSAIDKIAAWSGQIKRDDAVVHGNELFDEITASGKGALLIGSHLGNLELCRALAREDRRLKINAMVFNKNALKFQNVLNMSNEEAGLNLIHVEEIGINTAIVMRQKIDQGELVIIVGDRTSVSAVNRVQYVRFLGRDAPFSEGPFIMASLMDCPVYLIFCLREGRHYHVYLERFARTMKFPRNQRAQMLQDKIQVYADRLAHYCVKAPLQWFNFFDFWSVDHALVRGDTTGQTNCQQ